jgi:glycosyltransferase involved in cell wall biosynthesis
VNIVQLPRRFTRAYWGGTESVVLETSRRLAQRGHSVEVFCPDALADCREEIVEDVPVRRFPYFYPYVGLTAQARRQMDFSGGNLFSFGLLRALLSRPQLDLIHLHTSNRLGGIGRLASRLRRIPYVITIHGGILDVPSEEARRLVRPSKGAIEWGRVLGLVVGSRRVLHDAAAILCIGPEEQRRLQATYPGKRVMLLPNGVDAQRFGQGDGSRFRLRHGIPAGAAVVLNVGRIDAQKNQLLAVRAAARLRHDTRHVHIVLVGHVTDPSYRIRLEEEIRILGLGRRAVLLPGLDPRAQELVDAYHAADVLLMTSLHEPFGIAVLEAWAAGVPAVVSRVGGMMALVRDGIDGLFFSAGDMGGCVAALETVLENPELRKALGTRGRAKVIAEYSWDEVTRRLDALYSEVTAIARFPRAEPRQ